ncbi:MAG: hypothetical protein JETCAE02_00940 [Anaerolineaceae bacterium]|nr:hypothetical protein [Anaerolineae bacterium]MBL1171546.1 hypothetical protein [Chloroflexota bacterium]MDL1925302.1 hypothetical protein [Anaerolineae bacterium AMX1]WKZ54161.1 MAG: hypothetical protein QY324_15195 [Anaerolineales bacterium]GJQ37682.1 MAG: hypothetical protein JETCAE02_00940 [Anaerolineaceae bacterium]
MTVKSDILLAKNLLSDFPIYWDGRKSVLELKAASFNWRQMEWWGFYFEYVALNKFKGSFSIPGDKFGKVKTACFDFKGTINWDLKAKAIKSDDHQSILNDTEAMDWSIKQYGAHGLVVALCDVEYNDADRSFQKWHEELKGGKSKYEIEREQRTSISRYRKTKAELVEILFLVVTPKNKFNLGIHHQGRNSNGKPRPPKYMLDYDKIGKFLVDKIVFPPSNATSRKISEPGGIYRVNPDETPTID